MVGDLARTVRRGWTPSKCMSGMVVPYCPMSTFEVEPIMLRHGGAWRVKCSSSGHPPHFIEDGFQTCAEAQVRADSLKELEIREDS